MSSVANASTAASSAKPAKMPKSSARKEPKHPGFLEMMVKTILRTPLESLSKKRLAVRSLKEQITSAYNVPEHLVQRQVKHAIPRALQDSVLVKSSGIGLIGSVKFHPNFIMMLKNRKVKEAADPALPNLIAIYAKENRNSTALIKPLPTPKKKEVKSVEAAAPQPLVKNSAPKKRTDRPKTPGQKRAADKVSDGPKDKKTKK